jgi:hypothetical protein
MFEVARLKPSIRKLRDEIFGEPFNDFRTPAFILLPVQNVRPIDLYSRELPVDGNGGAHPGGADALLDFFEDGSIARR